MSSINAQAEEKGFWPISQNYYILLFTFAFLAVVACFTVLLSVVGETEVKPVVSYEILNFLRTPLGFTIILVSILTVSTVLAVYFKLIKLPF